MSTWLREGTGVLLALASLGVLFHAVTVLSDRDYLACIILALVGVSLMRAGVELLRPHEGER